MKKLFYLLLVCFIISICTSCKKENPGYSFPIYGFDFYLVNKETQENLVGPSGEHPYGLEEVEISVMYDNVPSTKKSLINRETYSIDKNEEIGYYFEVDYENGNHHVDYIFYLDDLKPDTITVINTLTSRGIELYINNVLADHFTQETYFKPGKSPVFYKIEKEL